MSYLFVIKEHEVLTCAASWKNLGDVTPSEISQVQKVLIDSRHLRCPQQAKPQRQKVDGWLSGAGEWWESKRQAGSLFGVVKTDRN